MATKRLTMAQALVDALIQQYVQFDGTEQPFFAGIFGIFGHGNVAGVGQALQQRPDFRYTLFRNEQAMVHTAAAFAKMNNRRKIPFEKFVQPSELKPSQHQSLQDCIDNKLLMQ